MSEIAKKEVLMYVTKYGLEYVLSAKMYLFLISDQSLDYLWALPLTLARKFELVHKKTVIVSIINPKLLLATFSSPSPFLNPPPDLRFCEKVIEV
jgi:hypothetical protein